MIKDERYPSMFKMVKGEKWVLSKDMTCGLCCSLTGVIGFAVLCGLVGGIFGACIGGVCGGVAGYLLGYL